MRECLRNLYGDKESPWELILRQNGGWRRNDPDDVCRDGYGKILFRGDRNKNLIPDENFSVDISTCLSDN
jgi:hypothetical protein